MLPVTLLTGTVETVRVTALGTACELNRRTVIVPLRGWPRACLALPGGATQLDMALNDVWGRSSLRRGCAPVSRTRPRAGRRRMPSWSLRSMRSP